MEFIVDQTNFINSLSHVQNVVERRQTIPILANVLINARGNQLILETTDMDIHINETVDADVRVDGAITVGAQTLHDIVRKLPDGAQISAKYSQDTGRLQLQSGRSRFTLQTINADEYPVMNAGDFPHSFALDSKILKNMIDKISLAISTEETRYYLNGIYVHVHDGTSEKKLRGVATDGHRLARFETDLPTGAENMDGIIIPRKAVTELRKLIDNIDDEIQIEISSSKIRFTFAHVAFTSKLIDGSFPDYERVIPDNNDKLLAINTKSLYDAVDRVAIISIERMRAVKLHISNGQLQLSVSSKDQGDAEEEIEVIFDYDDLEIGFNARYLTDILKQINSDSVDLLLNDSSAPVIINQHDNNDVLYVLMPMRI